MAESLRLWVDGWIKSGIFATASRLLPRRQNRGKAGGTHPNHRKQAYQNHGKYQDFHFLGRHTVRLYDDTPIHRDNFLKLASEGYYNGTLFHRVIRDFMIQGGDPDSKGAPAGKQLGVGGPDYTLQAEIKPHLFHKRGALCAARLGDEVNPNRESSDSQFYIVWGSVYNPSQLKQMEKQMKQNQVAVTFNDLVSYHKEEIMNMRRNRDRAGLQAMQEQLLKEAEDICKANPAGFTEEQVQAYTTVGGTPHLDGQYTVFGEVTDGLDVVEKIQGVKTLRGDRPCDDVEVIAMTVEA